MSGLYYPIRCFSDSIENNIEKTYTNVENGLVQLQKAVGHQVVKCKRIFLAENQFKIRTVHLNLNLAFLFLFY